jgi:hypothetical protein
MIDLAEHIAKRDKTRSKLYIKHLSTFPLGKLKPMCTKTEWLWNSHPNPDDSNWDAWLFVKYEVCIYADMKATAKPVETITRIEYEERESNGEIPGHWSFCEELDRH